MNYSPPQCYMKSMSTIVFSKKELTLIKKARSEVFEALTRMAELNFSLEAKSASIQAILLLGFIDDLVGSPVRVT